MYGSKRDKAPATKGWTVREGLSVWEIKWLMDVELFLEGQAKWEADSPHCLVMLHKMFQNASEQGQKEADHMVFWGCQHGLPKLDPEVDISAIQLVGPQTSRKEIESLCYKVYKLRRLPGSPPRETELEVVSSLEDCQGQEWREMPQTLGEPKSTGVPALREQDTQREGCLQRKKSCQGKRSPP